MVIIRGIIKQFRLCFVSQQLQVTSLAANSDCERQKQLKTASRPTNRPPRTGWLARHRTRASRIKLHPRKRTRVLATVACVTRRSPSWYYLLRTWILRAHWEVAGRSCGSSLCRGWLVVVLILAWDTICVDGRTWWHVDLRLAGYCIYAESG